ncbi:GHKL domain-containing protein [Holdemania massiliensis]|uniref:GHKL domain-containing protein n=1 Tax=Holdemania massiliensis TaxID=1468449 RepID=A0A6N7SBQ5_9FIRM|nr:GHKL domain-containing protein [Holdemania massiliensis]MSA73002.1 GHKL domain-containing protein [Holdemania massiliensis]MSA91199.1 GHKL domain-containing protein [Holdemania massiliensis]MSB80055.1 GHKL domain-containing protein [Holdemania massiliensis]MSC34976.1 GHKL domain-containing protein [Holdemania massiliensis]MSC41365.1 GHKL domain-containing protein [Holdemania massiliensis]
MLDQTLYYLNHIPLMMTWAYFYNEFLPVRKSYRKDYVMLAAAILAAVLVLIQIYEIPGSEQDNAVFRMTVSAATIGVVVYLVKGAGLKATVFALFAQQLLSITAEMVTMLITLVGVQFSRSAYEGSFYMNVYSYVLLDIMSLLFFMLALGIVRKRQGTTEGEYTTIGTLLLICQFLWLYILSYKLIYIVEASTMLLVQSLLFLLLTDAAVFVIARRIIRQKRKKQELEAKRQMNAELEIQLRKLSEKQEVINAVFKEMTGLDDQLETLSTLQHQMKQIREDLICANPYVNALLNAYLIEAKEKQISMQFEIKADLLKGIDNYDLNTLLSNLLKNAVEASENSEDPKVTLQLTEKAGLLMIRCCNNLAETSRPVKKRIQGQGLMIIDEILQRYQGTRSMKKEQNLAVAEVMLRKEG